MRKTTSIDKARRDKTAVAGAMIRYLIISPRGFANETVIRYGSAEAVRIAAAIINDDVNAWAIVASASHPQVRAAKRAYAKARLYMSAAQAKRQVGIDRLHEADVINHRPVYLPDHGPRYRGGPALPAGYDLPG